MASPTSVRTLRVQEWLRRAIALSGAQSFIDLHIDDVDDCWRSRDKWLDGAADCLRLAIRVIRDEASTWEVAIGMSLTPHSVPIGISARSSDDLVHEFDSSPPSLYVFESGTGPWYGDSGSVRKLEGTSWLPGISTQAYFLEWWDHNDDEFRRALWVIPVALGGS